VSALFEDLVEEEETRERGRYAHRKLKSEQWGKFVQLGAAIVCALSLSGRSNLCYGKGPMDGHSAIDPVNHIYRQI
jgi:hypothetical protein